MGLRHCYIGQSIGCIACTSVLGSADRGLLPDTGFLQRFKSRASTVHTHGLQMAWQHSNEQRWGGISPDLLQEKMTGSRPYTVAVKKVYIYI